MQPSPDLQLLNLPSYDVQENRRARNVHLKILPSGSLQVIVPPGFSHDRIPEIVHKKRHWIEKVQKRLQEQRTTLGFDLAAPLPTNIFLRAIAQDWQVHYDQTADPRVILRQGTPSSLILSGSTDQAEVCRVALRQWLADLARMNLIPWLEILSQDMELQFVKATIRGQRTRWGSCSRRKTISLNYKLMFLPPHLVRYVFIHELCHTVHLNHSQKFWELVREKEPDYRQLDQELHNSCCYVPLWVESHL
ncbi:metal-dependent hydrolase [Leptolyngbya sp. 'hensonii']|uniref:M48 family metallopeptidase n=1 Tax=Leptolyngbya sp. 'hensonii' TaxID=1922337 RepID=UPI00094F78CA|nr:SprT family zinc-dependent metalloprotease [Leptolyngbya sp. 'hensonii']OLP17870.1 metal-dependent hydrolase [Leptolyngbya sp. 'hensonii']